jgi:hypothetical protein
VLCINRHKSFGSLNGFDFPAYANALAVSKHPPTAVSHDVADLIRFSHGCSFRFVFTGVFPAKVVTDLLS